jgi:hypothetical protein
MTLDFQIFDFYNIVNSKINWKFGVKFVYFENLHDLQHIATFECE